MEPSREIIQVSEKAGETEVVLLGTPACTHYMVLGHGAGAGMDHPFMEGLADSLLTQGIGTLRYNFPYIHRGSKRPDRPPIAHSTILAAIEYLKSKVDAPIVLGGKSFGGRMTSQTIAVHQPEDVKALIFYGFPLHAPGKPGVERAEHLKDIKVPMLFLQGDRDAFAKMHLLTPLIESLPLAQLDLLEGGDHGFKFLKKVGIDFESALKLLAEHTATFIHSLS